MRKTLLTGAGFAEIWPDLLILIGFAVVVFPIALWIFQQAVNRARTEGSLAQY